MALAAPFTLSATDVGVSASIGIAFAGPDDDVPEVVLQLADMAMYQAKRKGGARYAILDRDEHHHINHRASLNRDLRGALGRGELCTEYQPIVATTDGRITGAEALIRWEHPTHGMIGPFTAVRLAEKSGMIAEIGRWVLERAFLDRGRWQHGDHPNEFEISVNISAHQLMAPDFPSTVETVLTDTNTKPRLVTLELTESVFAQDNKRAIMVLGDVKRLGVALALDDFGTGYSSLSYLKQFPVDIVKIDRIFIADIDRDAASRSIVGAVVGLAHDLGMTVVAEGIETAGQYELVAALDCDSCQGFHFARPISADDFDTLLTGNGGDGTRLPLRV